MSKGGGSSGGGAGTQTAQSTNAPWGPTQTYIKGGLSDLGKWYSSDYGRNPYPGSSVVPFNPMTEQALGRTEASVGRVGPALVLEHSAPPMESTISRIRRIADFGD